MNNKIDFFNEVMKVHDKENKKYNEKVANLIFTKYIDEFNIYYEIYNKISKCYNISPYSFQIKKENNAYKEIKKFRYKTESSTDLKEIYKQLKDEAVYFSDCCVAYINFSKNSEKNLLMIEIEVNNRNFNMKQECCRQLLNFSNVEEEEPVNE